MLLDHPAQPQIDLLKIDWMSEARARSCMIWGPYSLSGKTHRMDSLMISHILEGGWEASMSTSSSQQLNRACFGFST